MSTHAAQDRELDLVRGNIIELLLKIEQPIYINKRNRQDRSAIAEEQTDRTCYQYQRNRQDRSALAEEQTGPVSNSRGTGRTG